VSKLSAKVVLKVNYSFKTFNTAAAKGQIIESASDHFCIVLCVLGKPHGRSPGPDFVRSPSLFSHLHQSSDTICCFYPQALDGTCYADKTGSWDGLTIQNSCSSHRSDFKGIHIWQK